MVIYSSDEGEKGIVSTPQHRAVSACSVNAVSKLFIATGHSAASAH